MRPLLPLCAAVALVFSGSQAYAQVLTTQTLPALAIPPVNPGTQQATAQALRNQQDQARALQQAQQAATQPQTSAPVTPTGGQAAPPVTLPQVTTTAPAPVQPSPLSAPSAAVPVLLPTQAPLTAPGLTNPGLTTAPVLAPSNPSVVPTAPTGVANEDLELLRQQVLANMPMLAGQAQPAVIEEGYDPSLMRELYALGLEDDPVLRRAFRLQEDPEAMVREIGAQRTHLQVDMARNEAVKSRLDLHRTLMEFRAFLMDDQLKKMESITSVMDAQNGDSGKGGDGTMAPAADGAPAADPAAAVVPVVIPDPQVMAIYQHEDQSLARVVWMGRAWVVREGDVLPNGSTVRRITSQALFVQPKDTKAEPQMLLLGAG